MLMTAIIIMITITKIIIIIKLMYIAQLPYKETVLIPANITKKEIYP